MRRAQPFRTVRAPGETVRRFPFGNLLRPDRRWAGLSGSTEVLSPQIRRGGRSSNTVPKCCTARGGSWPVVRLCLLS